MSEFEEFEEGVKDVDITCASSSIFFLPILSAQAGWRIRKQWA